ncbi:MAG: hypothetical protein B6U73_00340 [Desulfurococcales archaeon ex4484_204]|nr:MAG: hypothetical protein B6U73_00340 [Desulfurococcales archaeon ex4484_204]
MYDIYDVINDFRDIVEPDRLLWVFSEASEVSARYVIMRFNANLSIIKGVNVIFRYIPMLDKILWIRLEVMISSDVSAKDFFIRIYRELGKMGCEVAIGRNSISIFSDLRPPKLSSKVVNRVREIAKLVSGQDIKEALKLKLTDYMVRG